MKRLFVLILLIQIGVCYSENSIIAIVNEEVITLQSINEEMSKASSFNEKLSILDRQIDTIIQLNKATEFGLSLSKDDINRATNKVAEYNNISIQQLKTYPEFPSLEKQIITSLTLIKLQQFITKDLVIDISDKEVMNNCTANTVDKKQIKIAQIIISEAESTNKSIESQEKVVKEFLKKLSSHILKGASFETLAKLHSQHPSYVNGGVSDWMFIDNPTIEMIDQLKDKEVSTIYQAGESWGIAIKVDERYIDLNFKKCKDKIKNQKIQDFYSEWIKKLRDSSYIEIYTDKL